MGERKTYEKECQYCGKIYNTTNPNALFCSLECCGKHQSEIKAKERIEKCKKIVESSGKVEIINIEMTRNRNRGDIFTIKCLKCGDIENISTRVISTGKYKGCKKCYEKHCRICGTNIYGYRKEDICYECKRKEILTEREEIKQKKKEELEKQRKQAIERINKEKRKIKKCISCGKEFTNSLLDTCDECNEILDKILHGIRCECCGEIFIPKLNKKYCSEQCRKKD